MIEVALLRQHLSLEKRSLTEIATALSVTAMVGATLYNLGFFAPVEWSLLSILSVQDLLIGASMALLPMAIAAWLALLFGRFIGRAPERPRRALLIALPLVVLGTAAACYFYYGDHRSTIWHLATSWLALGGLAAIANLIFRTRVLPLLWLAFSLVYIPFSAGIADSLGLVSNPAAPISEIETDHAMIKGTILRMTSGYAIIFEGRSMAVLPLSKIRSMRRLYTASPEIDYLGGATGELRSE